MPPEPGSNLKQLAIEVQTDWQVVRVDLWEVFPGMITEFMAGDGLSTGLWTNVAQFAARTNNCRISFLDQAPTTHRFYRVVIPWRP